MSHSVDQGIKKLAGLPRLVFALALCVVLSSYATWCVARRGFDRLEASLEDIQQAQPNQIKWDMLKEQGEQLDTCKVKLDKAEGLAIGSGPPIIGDVMCINDGPLVCHVFQDAEFDDIVTSTLRVLREVLSASWDFKEPCSLGMEALALATGKKCLGYWERKNPLPRFLPP